MAVLHESEQQQQLQKPTLDAMAETFPKRGPSEPLSSLDAMTEEFLKRSNARINSCQSWAIRYAEVLIAKQSVDL